MLNKVKSTVNMIGGGKLLKSIVVIFGLLSMTTFATNAYYSDQVTVTGNQFSTGTWHTPEAKLVINEIDYDQPVTPTEFNDSAEFIELMNTGDATINLNDYKIKMINGNDHNVVYKEVVLPDYNLVAGGYYVICANNATVANCNLDSSPNTDFIQNGMNGSTGMPDAVAIVKTSTGEIVDTVSYEGSVGSPYVEGSGVGLMDNPDNGNVGISRFPNGADTNQNNVDFQMRPITPGSSNN